MATATIDLRGLVEEGHLDLDAVFDDATWTDAGEIVASYTSCWAGEPEQITLHLETAVRFGLTAYRWTSRDASGEMVDAGSPLVSREGVEAAAEEYAAECHEEPDDEDEE